MGFSFISPEARRTLRAALRPASCLIWSAAAAEMMFWVWVRTRRDQGRVRNQAESEKKVL